MINKCWVCGGNIKKVVAEKLKTPIAELGLTSRAFNCLVRGGVEYVEQLVKLNFERLLCLNNLGKKTAEEIKGKVKAFGFECWQ